MKTVSFNKHPPTTTCAQPEGVRHEVVRYGDALTQERGLGDWRQRYIQLDREQYKGTITRLEFGRIQIFVEEIGVVTEQTTTPPDGKLILVFPQNPPVGLVTNVPKTETTCFYNVGGRELKIVKQPGAVVYLQLELIDVLPGLDVDRLPSIRLIKDNQRVAELRHWLSSLLATLPASKMAVNKSSVEVLSSLIVDAVREIMAVVMGSSQSVQLNETSELKAVWRARKLLEDQRTVDIQGTREISAYLKIPEHRLRAAFLAVTGLKPSRWLRQIRLDLAHRELMFDPEKSVTQIALDAGFSHFGRFAEYYRQTYNRLPSETRGMAI